MLHINLSWESSDFSYDSFSILLLFVEYRHSLCKIGDKCSVLNVIVLTRSVISYARDSVHLHYCEPYAWLDWNSTYNRL
jgi:hypothetical protein